MVGINDPERDEIVQTMMEFGRSAYRETIDKDGSEDLQNTIDSMIREFYECHIFSLFLDAFSQTPKMEDYNAAATNVFFYSLKKAALEAGHTQNAEYISQALARLKELE